MPAVAREEGQAVPSRFAYGMAAMGAPRGPRGRRRISPQPFHDAALIGHSLANAQAAGRDHLAQTETAVRAVLQARPDMTASEALAAVNLARRS